MSNLFAERKTRFLRKLCLPETLAMLFICLPLAAHSASVPPQQSAREQVNGQIIAKVSKSLDALAKRQQWQDYRYRLNLFIPPMVANLPACGEPLKIVATPFTVKNLNHLNVSASCTGAAPWRILVTVKPDVYVPVVMPKEEVERGEALSADELVLKKFNISNQRGELFYQVKDAVGLSAKRTLMAYKPISSAQLQMPMLVKRDEAVTIVSQFGDISAQTAGVALKNGHKGDVIKVRNDNSQRIVTAAVEDAGIVKVTAVE
jgi:flagella basal body P-ring formation protein FlgA